MRSRIQQAFDRARSEGRCAFIPYMTGGYPDAETCMEILQALGQSGADLVEVGIPFSDPLADGPTIQEASWQALNAGATPKGVLRLVERARAIMEAPVILMTYWNPVLRMGPRDFARRAMDAGAAGAIVPDLPPEEAAEWVEISGACGLEAIFLVAPTTSTERLDRILPVCRGFVYCVTLTGVTGGRCEVSSGLLRAIQKIKTRSPLPVAVGFGISTPEQARRLSGVADGVIVGSALIRALQSQEGARGKVEAACRFAASMREALRLKRTSEVLCETDSGQGCP